MCVSGLPERIGMYHVTEICNMALVILNTVKHFTIRHMPMHPLQVRIGVHSGNIDKLFPQLNIIILILLKLEVISVCHQYKAKPNYNISYAP